MQQHHKRPLPVTLLILTAILLLTSAPVLAHGAQVMWDFHEDSVHISAAFDNGVPMSDAQVTVFSGAAPTEPYLRGLTDENGVFVFKPDLHLSLNWDVQVRKAGHGDIVHFSMMQTSEVIIEERAFTTLQIIIMSVSVVWGFIGTALFFASKRKDKNAHS